MIDLVIIGGGPGGYEAALKAASVGLSVVLIEKSKLGGTCLNEGCIPTKSYYKNAEVYQTILSGSDYGVMVHNPTFDFNAIKKRKDEVVETLTKGIAYNLDKAKVRVIYGKGELVSKNQVKVNDEIIEAKNIILAFGSKNKSLPITGSELMIDSTALLNKTELMKSLIVVGGGVIGVEFASILNNFGVKVTIIEYLDQILPAFDEELSKKLRLILKKKGIEIINSAKVLKVEMKDGEKEVTYQTKDGEFKLAASEVLASVGRMGNIDDKALANFKIEVERGFIKVDEDFKTSLDNVYAIGDCNGVSLLAHSATFQGYHVIDHLLNKSSKINFRITPSVLFAFPLVASVGLSEKEATSRNINYKVVKSFYRANGKAHANNDTEGFIKLLISDDKTILGGHILGAEADSLIHEIMVLMNQQTKINEAKDYIHAHPTLAEVIQAAIHAFNE